MSKFVAAMTVSIVLLALGCGQTDRGEPEKGVEEISQETLLNDPPEDALILDVRTPEEYASGHVPEARNIPHDQLAERLAEIAGPTDRPVVVYCRSGGRAGKAAATLVAAGYTNVRHLTGDMLEWEARGLPMVTDGEALP